MGMRETAHINEDGTWLEPEAFCYPRGGMTRRAYAVCPDGKKRVITCGIPDTYFSIPARHSRLGKGYLTGEDGSMQFRLYTK
jgi:hypothetical protein